MAVKGYIDQEIIDRVMSHAEGWKAWPTGPLDVHIRSDEDEWNVFDDKAYSFECFGPMRQPEFVMVRWETTNAGSYGLLHFDEYNHDGCAVLKSDIYIPESHIYGLHKGKPGYRQNKDWPYYRDNNRNRRVEEIGIVRHGIIGANIHRAGTDSTVINNWSTACLVTRREVDFIKFLQWARKRPMNTALLMEW